MRLETIKSSIKIVLVVFLLISINCAPGKRYKVLSIFFDGVPEPGKKKEKKEEAKPQEQAKQQKNKIRQDVIQIISRHPGYAEGRCTECHDRSAANFLRTRRDTLCFNCHNQKDFQGAFVHGPVSVRACQTCHLPHESQYSKLLITKAGEMCVYCHLVEDIAQNPVHSIRSIADTGKVTQPGKCTECHYAHAADNRFFLKDTSTVQEGE